MIPHALRRVPSIVAARRPHFWLTTIIIGLGITALATPVVQSAAKKPAPATDKPATPETIDAAIKKGVAYIYSQQKPGGHWEESDHRTGEAHIWKNGDGDSFGGFTSLSTYALLAAGELPTEKRMAGAIAFLKKADVIGIYSLGLRAQVWHILAQKRKNKDEMQSLADADAKRILNGVNTSGPNKGLWDYGNGLGKRTDHSVSQYGILGLWALQEAGAKIDIKYWRVFDEVWRAGQFNDGGWVYDENPQTKVKKGKPPTAAMTAAGIATLFITQDNTYADLPDHHGNVFNANIENGLRWMTNHFAEVGNNYSWYGVERIGVASGTKYFGTIDWFQHGAEHLINTQQADGHWPGSGPGNSLSDTCFAVLFLARGRAPIMLNKLRYSLAGKDEGDWNERPRDAANLTKWSAEQIESNLNWQLVNLQVSAEDLGDAPILYLAGDQALNFTPEEEEKLKTFVHEGGILLGNADYGTRAFRDSFMKLGTKLFGYEFRELESNSPIWSEQTKVSRARLKVLAMTNGIREIMVLLGTGDPAKIWQTPPADDAKSDQLGIGANLFLYAVDKKNLLFRGETNLVIPNPALKPARTLEIARLQYGGNWNPEPGGWSRLSAIFHNDLKINLEVKTVDLGKGQLSPFKVAHITGTTKFQLSDEQAEELQKFLAAGGTLLVDAAGGSSDFSISAETMIRKLSPDSAEGGLRAPLPPESSLYTLPEHKIEKVEYRTFAKTIVGNLHTGRVYGITEKGRTAIYFSKEDITGGLVGHPTDGIIGYSPATATEIMRNLILIAAPK